MNAVMLSGVVVNKNDHGFIIRETTTNNNITCRYAKSDVEINDIVEVQGSLNVIKATKSIKTKDNGINVETNFSIPVMVVEVMNLTKVGVNNQPLPQSQYAKQVEAEQQAVQHQPQAKSENKKGKVKGLETNNQNASLPFI